MAPARALVLVLALAACAAFAGPPIQIALSPDAPTAFVSEHPNRPQLGVNVRHTDEPAPLVAMHEAGLDFVRTDLFWSDVEQQSGHYDFSEYDAGLANIHAAGLHTLLILDYLNDAHTEGHLDTPAEIAAFAHYANVAATHYRGRDIVWEIWNEPDVRESDHYIEPEVFARLVRETAHAIHAADPHAHVISGGLSYVNLEYAQTMFAEWAEHGAPEIVAFGVHPYRRDTPDTAYDDLAALSLAMTQGDHPQHWPLWSSEWGYSSSNLPHPHGDGHNPASRNLQAAYATRAALTAWLGNADASAWYEIRDEEDKARDDGDNFGLLDHAGAPKAALRALTTLVTQTRGFHLVGPLDQLPDGVQALKFESADRIMIAVWPREEGGRLSLSVEPAKFIGAVNNAGDPVTLTNNRLQLRDVDGPLYLSWRR